MNFQPLNSLKKDYQVFTYLKKGQTGIFKGGTFRVNNFGFRGKDILVSKPKDTIRIIICGRSSDMGAGVNENENYGSILEVELNRSFGEKKIEVLNFSCLLYTSDAADD